MATKNGIIRLSNIARYDENIKRYIADAINNIALGNHPEITVNNVAATTNIKSKGI
mgnify:CR=1 FL=1